MRTYSNLLSSRPVRLSLLLIGIAFCIWTIRESAAFGLSRLFARYALVTRNPEVARITTELSPNDAQAYHTAATVLALTGSPDQTLSALEQAAALRPSDYTLWLALGLTRDQLGNTAGALTAFDEAVRRAPFYARPRWQRGNLLLRSGQYDAAFKDLSQAAESNPDLIPLAIDLAWRISNGDTARTEQLAQVRSPRSRIAFAKLLIQEGRAKDALAQFNAAGVAGDDVRSNLVQQLLAKSAYHEAFEVWQAGASGGDVAAIYDGGFEGPMNLNEKGFGWRVAGESRGLRMSLDNAEPNTGSKSLMINFQGNSAAPFLSQLIMVEPGRRYRVNFAVWPKDIVSGGPPLAVVTDATSRERLGQSIALAKGSDGWQMISFEFMATPNTNAVVLGIERESCPTSPCPIFGTLALDSFSMERVK
jgi:hypothetical protein